MNPFRMDQGKSIAMNRYRTIGYLTALLILIMMYFPDVLSGGRILVERDLPVFAYPNLHFWVDEVKNLSFPLWNPYLFSGEPLFANLQPAVLYPLSFIYFILPLDVAFNYNILIHFFLAGIFTFLLAREISKSDTSAAIASLSFTFGGYLISVHNLLPTLQSVTWFPLVLLFFLRSFSHRSRGYAMLAGGTLCIMFMGGGAEVPPLTLGVLLFLTLFPGIIEDYPGLAVRGFYLLLVLLLFFGLGAIQIIPLMELKGHSIRSSAMGFELATAWSLHPKNLIYLLLPDFFWRGPDFYYVDQNWLKTIYVGVAPLVLFFFSMGERSKRKILLLSLVLIPLILSMGRHTFLYQYLYSYVPFIGVIRYPSKFLFVSLFFLSIASGLGWTHFKEMVNSGNPSIYRASITLLIIGVSSALVLGIICFFPGETEAYLTVNLPVGQERLWSDNLHNIARVLVYISLVGLLISWGVRNRARFFLANIGIIVLIISDLFLGNQGFYKSMDRSKFHRKTPNINAILSDTSLYRIYSPPQLKEAAIDSPGIDNMVDKLIKDLFFSNYPMVMRAFDASGFGVLTNKHYFDLISLAETAPHPNSTEILNLMNVKYLLWDESLDIPEYELVREGETYLRSSRDSNERESFRVCLYRNRNCLPRAYLVDEYRVIGDDSDYKAIFEKKEFNPRDLVLLREEPRFHPKNRKEESNEKLKDGVKIIEYKPREIKLVARANGPKILVLSDAHYPGWKAFVDGEERGIYRANHAFRAIALEPGSHRVDFVYDPWSFKLGLLITISTLSLLLGLWAFRFFRGNSTSLR